MPESSKWQYTWQEYSKARESLAYIARTNRKSEKSVKHIENLVFDAEIINKDQSIDMEERASQKDQLR